ncbi:hypothetical protein [Variovorax paradoxus]|uniref:hypothetical protein n=1 Tax=Variovorax paradoxus TaxID=34073 RepID=UPI001ABC4E61
MPYLLPVPVGHYLDPNQPFPLDPYNWQFLAEGDSWFSITDEVLNNRNLLPCLHFPKAAAAINCAAPGDIAGKMFKRNPQFKMLLQQRWWLAILVSASGNDLIDAINVTPNDSTGQLRPARERILLTKAEAIDASDPHAYVSEAGMNALAGYLLWWFASLVEWRDAGQSKGRPVFLHTYSVPVARPAGVPGKSKGWLHPALVRNGVPKDLHQGVTDIVFGKLRLFLLGLDTDARSGYQLPNVHVFDSAAIPLDQADPDATGPSGDWVNEIHLRTSGAEKLGQPFSSFILQRFSRYGMPG